MKQKSNSFDISYKNKIKQKVETIHTDVCLISQKKTKVIDVKNNNLGHVGQNLLL